VAENLSLLGSSEQDSRDVKRSFAASSPTEKSLQLQFLHLGAEEALMIRHTHEDYALRHCNKRNESKSDIVKRD
jgi:hypothetical protein